MEETFPNRLDCYGDWWSDDINNCRGCEHESRCQAERERKKVFAGNVVLMWEAAKEIEGWKMFQRL